MTLTASPSLWEQAYYPERGWPMPGVPILDIFHAIVVARDFQLNAEPQPFLQQLVAYMLSALGGTLVGSVLLGQPVGWLASDLNIAIYVTVFALSWMSATRGPFRALVNAPLLGTLLSLGDDASWANSTTMMGVQRALAPMHAASPIKHSISAALVLGTLAGCGGGIIRATFGFNQRAWSFSVPRQLSAPLSHFHLRTTFLVSVLFYALTNPHGYLPWLPTDLHHAKWMAIACCMAANTGMGVMAKIATPPAPATKAKQVAASSPSALKQGHEETTEEEVSPAPAPIKRKHKKGNSNGSRGKKVE